MKTPIDNYWTVQRGYLHGQPTFYNNFHLGVDLIVPEGTPIYAPEDGEVVKRKGDQGGVTAELRADNRWYRFLHLSRVLMTGRVGKGDKIALSGNTGLSDGPHIHFDVRPPGTNINSYRQFINPDSLFSELEPEIEYEEVPVRVPMEDGTKVEVNVGGIALWSVPTDDQNHTDKTGEAMRGERLTVIDQTDDYAWVNIAGDGKQGWTRLGDPNQEPEIGYWLKVVPSADENTKQKAVMMAEKLVEGLKKL